VATDPTLKGQLPLFNGENWANGSRAHVTHY